MNLRTFTSPKERGAALEKKLNISLENINKGLIDDQEDVHCENLIGAISIPLGIAGPIKINGEKVRGDYYLPLATTEGALVASVSRGCKAITLSDGANVYAYRVGATRGPVFYTGSLKKSKELYTWITQNENKIKAEAESTSKHLTYKKVMVKGTSDYVFARFYYDTQDAMGMNMVTIATEKVVQLIEKETGITCLSLAGNFDIDKKPSWLNFTSNRGFKIWGEVILSEQVLQDVLKSDAQSIFDVWLGKCMLGSAMSGSLGFNSHFANIVAAFFAATGQDLAHIVEGSMGITTTKVLPDKKLYFAVYLPDVMLGSVGGGTKLKTQTEARKIIGVNKSEEMAEVLAAAVLAGELSLLASLAEQSLAKAHKKLGR